MSKRLRGACVAGATLLLAEFFGFTVGARPPDLPVQYQDIYAPTDAGEGQPAPKPEPRPASADPWEQEDVLIEEKEQPADSSPPDKHSLTVGLCIFPPLGISVTYKGTEPPRAALREVVGDMVEAFGAWLFGDGAQTAQTDQPRGMPQHATKARTKRDTGHLTDTPTELHRLNEARRMFRIAEQCRRDGDLDMAINCYQETHLLSPTSRYGLLAIERLGEIDAQRLDDAAGAGEEQETPETTLPSNSSGEQIPDRGPAEAGKIAAAREMFVIGERCRQSGDLDMALNCYHEAKLLAPHSVYGRQAQIRIREIQAARQDKQGSTEEQEPPVPEQSSNSATPGGSGMMSNPSWGPVGVSPTMSWAVPNSTLTGPPPATPSNLPMPYRPTPRKQEKPRKAPPSRDEGLQSQAPAAGSGLEIVQEESSSSAAPGNVAGRTHQVPLFVAPAARRLTIQTEESETSGETSDPSATEFQGWLQQTGDVFRGLSGIDIDVDVAVSGTMRLQGGIRAGGLTGTITLDEGRSYFKVQKPVISPVSPPGWFGDIPQ